MTFSFYFRVRKTPLVKAGALIVFPVIQLIRKLFQNLIDSFSF